MGVGGGAGVIVDSDLGYTDSIAAATISPSGAYTIDSLFPAAEPRVAKDHECPHCFRQRHPEPLTQRQAKMYDSCVFDASYGVLADTSPVVCIGADYQGPAVVGCKPYGWMSGLYTWPTYNYVEYFVPGLMARCARCHAV